MRLCTRRGWGDPAQCPAQCWSYSSDQKCQSLSAFLTVCGWGCKKTHNLAGSNLKHNFHEDHRHVYIPPGTLDYKPTWVFATLEHPSFLMLNVWVLCMHQVFNLVKRVILLSSFYMWGRAELKGELTLQGHTTNDSWNSYLTAPHA